MSQIEPKTGPFNATVEEDDDTSSSDHTPTAPYQVFDWLPSDKYAPLWEDIKQVTEALKALKEEAKKQSQSNDRGEGEIVIEDAESGQESAESSRADLDISGTTGTSDC